MEVIQVLLVLALGMPTLGLLAPAVRKPGHLDGSRPGLSRQQAPQVEIIPESFLCSPGIFQLRLQMSQNNDIPY